VVAEKPLDLILTEISTGYYREAISSLRRYIHYDQQGHYENYKKALPTFTPSGIFKTNGNQLVLTKYSQYILLDTEKISPSEMFNARKNLASDPHTLAYFKSPSGCSLKIIVEVNSAWAYHKEAYLTVKEYYKTLLSLPLANAERNFEQLCFYSYDSELYKNSNNEIFNIPIPNF
jgi:hypothetical protein